ncbi:hypothetical protein [Methylobacterium gnaphalii]|uniref:Uncharacterized protein n=1 Tax=Methylobacterium gnaphalii TaxID=1010610 RepID=A0A512JGQ0_9HYPH|nr:hypothetical protein [Methylobacterium gnaphalii]GEP09113.1 hypothetical protein MGN01_09580 [Methylobacterium gnaphalii]GJD68427.1 hypothetical protein MMMDOFMJ_1350 [Methylobacterium gnaphalii]GLS49037.1 hypothetical protein GCM10007885_18840 [Methylobacterium gnaphalii]
MSLPRTLLVLSALALPAALVPGPASAQNFFEELFGIGRAARPPVPRQPVPAEPVPGAPGPVDPSQEAKPTAPPPPRQPVVLRTPVEDNVFGQDLMLNGLTGGLKLERAGTGVTAKVTLPGTKISQPTESCTVKLSAGAPVALTSSGKPEGVTRFEAAAAECPLRFEILDGSVLATPLGGSAICTFSAADCATTPKGLWGPPAASLIARSGEFDSARGTADRAVYDNYKIMTQRVRGQDVRPIVQEQAAFSSDREEICRTYAREGAHGFCHLRYTEARAISLATRLGVTAPTASVAPRPVRRKPAAVDGVNPDSGAAAIAE